MPAQTGWRRLTRFLDRKSWSTSSDPFFLMGLFGGAPTAAGIPVSPESAMRVAAVADAVRLISEAAGTTPAKVFSRDPKASAPDHAAYPLIHDFANEWTSAAALREAVTADALKHRHGYARAIRVNGVVQELHRIDQRCTQVQRRCNELTGEPVYIVGIGADAISVPHTDMIDIADFDETATFERAREAIALSALLERHTSRFFAKGARPSSIVMFKDKLPAGVLDRVKTAWNEAHSGDNAGGTAFVDGTGGGDFQTVTPSAQASELSTQRAYQVIEIARHFNVPPTMLFALDRATWSNVEQLMLQFRQTTMRPWLERWQDAYTRVLLSPDERNDFYIEFLLDDLASADQATQATALSQYRAMGAMTANEVRAVRNLPAHADGDTLDNPNITAPSLTV